MAKSFVRVKFTEKQSLGKIKRSAGKETHEQHISFKDRDLIKIILHCTMEGRRDDKNV